MKSQRLAGFTLIELIAVVVILGIIAATAVMRFINMRENAKRAVEEYTARAVQSGIVIYSMEEEVEEE